MSHADISRQNEPRNTRNLLRESEPCRQTRNSLCEFLVVAAFEVEKQ